MRGTIRRDINPYIKAWKGNSVGGMDPREDERLRDTAPIATIRSSKKTQQANNHNINEEDLTYFLY